MGICFGQNVVDPHKNERSSSGHPRAIETVGGTNKKPAAVNQNDWQLSELPPVPAAGTPKFEPVNVPTFWDYFPRSEDEQRIRSAIIASCNDPSLGVLVISGDSGVGKTSLVARVLTADYHPNHASVLLRQPNAVFWLNCAQWRDHFNDDDKRVFDNELMTIAKLDPHFHASTPGMIAPYFNEKLNKRILFIFDDMFNGAILSHFFSKQKDRSLFSCCVITSDPLPLNFGNINFCKIRPQPEKLEALTPQDMQIMLETSFTMKGKLSPEQLSNVSKLCFGLPVIAGLIRGWFGKLANWNGAYDELILSLSSPTANRKFETVLHLFQSNMDSLGDEKLYHFYYAFLFFDPGVPVSEKDLAVFWGSSSSDAVSKFTGACLIRIAIVPNVREQHYLIHHMLFEAALQKASDEFKLEGSADIRLQQLREKLVSGDLKSHSSPEMVMFEAVRQQRLALCRRFVDVMTPQSLVKFCLSPSTLDGLLFLHFLYRSRWPQFDVKLRDVEWGLDVWGVNNSYRLIRSVLLKLKSQSKVAALFQHLSTDKKLADFLSEVFADEYEISESFEVEPVIRLLHHWRPIYLEKRWREQVLSNEPDSIQAAIIQNDFGKFQKIFQNWKESQSQHEATVVKVEDGQSGSGDSSLEPEFVTMATITTARLGRLEMLKNLQQLYDDLSTRKNGKGETALNFACRNGHLEVVKLLSAESVSDGDNDGWTPMMSACDGGHFEVVKYLSEVDAKSVSQSRHDGVTPIMVACEAGQLEVVAFLFQKATLTLSQADREGRSPIMFACEYGHLEVVKFLAEKDPSSISRADKHGWTPIMSACRTGWLDVVKFLAEKDPKSVSQADVDGWTPLMSAVESGQLDVVEFLLEKNPSLISKADHDGNTPVEHARRCRHLQLANFLETFHQ